MPVRATRFLMLARDDGALLLERRPPSGIWGGLWGFPELGEREDALTRCAQLGLEANGKPRRLPPLTHTFTHFQLVITPLRLRVRERGAACMDSATLLWYNAAAPAAIGLAKPVQDLIRAHGATQETSP